MDYAIPSSRFERKNQAQAVEPMNFYSPPKNPQYANSGVSNAGADSQGALPQYYKPAPAATRPGAVPVPGVESYAAPVMAGMQNSQTPATTDFATQAASVAGNTLSGAASGALAGAAIGAAGGPIGALGGAAIGGGVALVTSGLNAWLGNKQARSARDQQNALVAEANRIRQEEVARDEKWRVQNRLDSLEAAREERKRYNQTQARQNMADTATRLQAALANNAGLRANWAKYGFN